MELDLQKPLLGSVVVVGFLFCAIALLNGRLSSFGIGAVVVGEVRWWDFLLLIQKV